MINWFCYLFQRSRRRPRSLQRSIGWFGKFGFHWNTLDNKILIHLFLVMIIIAFCSHQMLLVAWWNFVKQFRLEQSIWLKFRTLQELMTWLQFKWSHETLSSHSLFHCIKTPLMRWLKFFLVRTNPFFSVFSYW